MVESTSDFGLKTWCKVSVSIHLDPLIRHDYVNGHMPRKDRWMELAPSCRNLRRLLSNHEIIGFLEGNFYSILILRNGTSRWYFAETILLDFSRESILIQGTATVQSGDLTYGVG